MVILKTKEFKKVNKHLDIITSLWVKDLDLTRSQIFELMCLYYDYLIRDDSYDKMSESEFTVRSYNVLSDMSIIFTKDDFEYDNFDEYNYFNNMLFYIKRLTSNLTNILLYLETVYKRYGILFKTYRSIRKAHEVVDLFKYGFNIERTELLNCDDNINDIDFLQCYVDKAIPDFNYDISKLVFKIDNRFRYILTAICEQNRREPFRYMQEAI